ncbi:MULTISPECIES: ABC transporter permease [Planktothricoides]|uniref:ABC transporter permease n=1 Tax=Planktothricoides raciborskii GIHE-MW2 TaxID=2792601 RepID=A0AAU8JEJ1_9CYAN|nr:ABC transporter permease [Planktothricoides sp. SR001]KOR34464.1 macrolide ABC transporter ATP-binding protein [Planktothricoides sp. SR001]
MSLTPIDLLKLTYLSLSGNLLRSALTSVGVFMGVAAVSATLQVGTISRAVVAKKLAEREAPQIIVFPYDASNDWEPVDVKLEDIEFLRKRLVGSQAIAVINRVYSWETRFRDRQANPQPKITAVSQGFLETSGRRIISGSFFTQADFDKYRPVVVIDEALVEALFLDSNPIGERIDIDGRPYFVRGVMETKLRGSWDEGNGEAIIPLSVYSALTGDQTLSLILIRPESLEEIDPMSEQVSKLLKRRFSGKELSTWNNIRDIKEQQDTLLMVSRSLLAVGAIALLVGGVGIANITIATVMERTAEIGLRRAIGATQADIMLQFILEAALLSLIGGILAIGTVHGITIVVADTFKLPYKFEPPTAGLALGSALLVGVGAGFFPALQASQLDPVKALSSG